MQMSHMIQKRAGAKNQNFTKIKKEKQHLRKEFSFSVVYTGKNEASEKETDKRLD